MNANRWLAAATALLWAAAICAAEPRAEPRQFELELPDVVVDPDVGEITLPNWVQDNRVPEDEWSRDHRVGMRLVDATSRPLPGGNAVALIHAVNRLQAMGRQEAVSVLRDYAARNNGIQDWRLAPIVQLLFSPVDPKGIAPPRDWYDLQQESWRVNSVGIVVSGDIPFYVFEGFVLSGWVPSTAALVEWAARHGTFRTEPLAPTANQFEAADQALVGLTQNVTLKKSIGSAEAFQQFIDDRKPLFHKQASRVATQ